jgi:hypothetical protein
MNWNRSESVLPGMVWRALLAVAAVVMSGAALIAAGQGNAASEAQARTLQGTWRVQITLRNCQTGEALRPPFAALATFAAGGTLTTADGGLSPLVRGAGHGIWRHTTDHSFEALSDAFLFTPAGILNGTQRLRQSIDIGWDPDEFTAVVSAEILDAQGTVLGTGCATSAGRRMEF